MRGRTNISGGNGGLNINGAIKQYEVTGGAITSGDFVQLYSQGSDYSQFGYPLYYTSSVIPPHKAKKISDNKFVALYIAKNGSAINTTLALIDISNTFTILDSVIIDNAVRSDIDILNDGTIVVSAYKSSSSIYIYRYEISNANKLEKMSAYKSTNLIHAIVAFPSFNKFMAIGVNGGALYVQVFDYTTDGMTLAGSNTSLSLSNSFNAFGLVGVGVLDDLTAVVSTVATSDTYSAHSSSIIKITMPNSNPSDYNQLTASDTRIGSTGKIAKILNSGRDSLFEKKIALTEVLSNSVYDCAIGLVKVEGDMTLLSSIDLPDTSTPVCVGKISNNKLILASIDGNDYMRFQIVTIDETSYLPTLGEEYVSQMNCYDDSSYNYYRTTGFFLTGTNAIYYIGNNGANSAIIKLKVDGTTITEGGAMVMPYANTINGIAKNSGAVGDTIDVYVPDTTDS